MSLGLVLEGGGMRGVYTAGVLEYFLENGVHFPYVIGVSAGAGSAASYISRQLGRNRKVTIGYVNHPRYLNVRNLWRERSLFGMSFIFDEIPNRLEPFDYDRFYRAEETFVVPATEAYSGEPVYFTKKAGEDFMPVIRASSSLPFVSTPVIIGGRVLFDGGVSDPIPLLKSEKDGNRRNVVILTKPAGYRKEPFKMRRLARAFYREYPGLVNALLQRAQKYNGTIDELERKRDDGSVFLIRPSADLQVGRMEKKTERLEALYELGYRDAAQQADRLGEWMAQSVELV